MNDTQKSSKRIKRIKSIDELPWFGRVTTVAFLIIGFLIYGSGLSAPFIWDDFTLVTSNPHIRGWGNFWNLFQGNVVEQSSFYRPIQMFSYLLDYELWSLNSKGFRISSVLLHIGAALSLTWFF